MATTTTRRGNLGGLSKWWGLLAGLLLIAAWINKAAGPPVVLALSTIVMLWCFFQAPVSCKAEVRGGRDGCRNNAAGLLLGCHIRQHRWQKLKMLVVRRQVRTFCRGMFSDGKTSVVTLAGIGGFASGLAALFPGIVVT